METVLYGKKPKKVTLKWMFVNKSSKQNFLKHAILKKKKLEFSIQICVKMAEFLPDFASLDQFNQEALRALALATKASNGIPSDRKEDWDFYTTFKSFRQVTDAQSDTIRKLIAAFVNHNGIKCSIPRNDSTNTSDILEMLSDFNDQLLERISSNLDEAVGLKTEIDPVLVEITDTRKTDNSMDILTIASPFNPILLVFFLVILNLQELTNKIF